MRSRQEVVKLAKSWLGKKESDGSYMTIIDLYNSQKIFPRGVKMQPGWSWCACTWSAIPIALGYTDIMPVEISCGELVNLAKKMGIWKENDSYIPSPGDGILYDWDDNGVGDNTGWPDHIGIVETVSQSAGYFTVIEGNYQNAVKRRTVSINGRYIRGFITPKYTDDNVGIEKVVDYETYSINTIAHEVIAGRFGDGDEQVRALKELGVDTVAVRKRVDEILNRDVKEVVLSNSLYQPYSKRVIATCKAATTDTTIKGVYETTANLHCRNDAGSNKKALCLIPKGTVVTATGGRTGNWYVVTCVLDRVLYQGFSHRTYLTKV